MDEGVAVEEAFAPGVFEIGEGLGGSGFLGGFLPETAPAGSQRYKEDPPLQSEDAWLPGKKRRDPHTPRESPFRQAQGNPALH